MGLSEVVHNSHGWVKAQAVIDNISEFESLRPIADALGFLIASQLTHDTSDEEHLIEDQHDVVKSMTRRMKIETLEWMARNSDKASVIIDAACGRTPCAAREEVVKSVDLVSVIMSFLPKENESAKKVNVTMRSACINANAEEVYLAGRMKWITNLVSNEYAHLNGRQVVLEEGRLSSTTLSPLNLARPGPGAAKGMT